MRSNVVPSSRVFPVAVLALAVLAGSALAQKADQPSVKVGDQWQFVMYYGIPFTKPNRVWVVNSVTPTDSEGTENGEPLMLPAARAVVKSVTRSPYRGMPTVELVEFQLRP